MEILSIQPLAVSVADACKMAGVGKTFLYDRLAAGDVRAVKAGNRTLVLVESLRDWLNNLPAAN